MIIATFKGALMLTKLYDDPRFVATAADRLRRRAGRCPARGVEHGPLLHRTRAIYNGSRARATRTAGGEPRFHPAVRGSGDAFRREVRESHLPDTVRGIWRDLAQSLSRRATGEPRMRRCHRPMAMTVPTPRANDGAHPPPYSAASAMEPHAGLRPAPGRKRGRRAPDVPVFWRIGSGRVGFRFSFRRTMQ
jgi:hypothetical protein